MSGPNTNNNTYEIYHSDPGSDDSSSSSTPVEYVFDPEGASDHDPQVGSSVDDIVAAPIPGAPAGGSPNAVNTDALNAFADSLDSFMDMIRAAQKMLLDPPVTVPAGVFPHAIALRDAVLGSDSSDDDGAMSGAVKVVPGSRDFLENALNAMVELQDDTRKMARIYGNAELSGEDRVNQLNAVLTDASTTLNDQVDAQVTAPTTV